MTVDFRGMLRDAAEPDLAEFSSKLTPGKQGIIGVRVPVIRNIARQVVKDGWEQILDGEPESFEEEMLRGVVIATAPVGSASRRTSSGMLTTGPHATSSATPGSSGRASRTSSGTTSRR